MLHRPLSAMALRLRLSLRTTTAVSPRVAAPHRAPLAPSAAAARPRFTSTAPERAFTFVRHSLAVKTVIMVGGACVGGYYYYYYYLWRNTTRPAAVSDRVLQTIESGGEPGWDTEYDEDAAASIKRPTWRGSSRSSSIRPPRAT